MLRRPKIFISNSYRLPGTPLFSQRLSSAIMESTSFPVHIRKKPGRPSKQHPASPTKPKRKRKPPPKTICRCGCGLLLSKRQERRHLNLAASGLPVIQAAQTSSSSDDGDIGGPLAEECYSCEGSTVEPGHPDIGDMDGMMHDTGSMDIGSGETTVRFSTSLPNPSTDVTIERPSRNMLPGNSRRSI